MNGTLRAAILRSIITCGEIHSKVYISRRKHYFIEQPVVYTE